MPYIGVQVPIGADSKGCKRELRFGTFLGGHVGSMVSPSGEVTPDLLRPSDDAGSYSDFTGRVFTHACRSCSGERVDAARQFQGSREGCRPRPQRRTSQSKGQASHSVAAQGDDGARNLQN